MKSKETGSPAASVKRKSEPARAEPDCADSGMSTFVSNGAGLPAALVKEAVIVTGMAPARSFTVDMSAVRSMPVGRRSHSSSTIRAGVATARQPSIGGPLWIMET